MVLRSSYFVFMPFLDRLTAASSWRLESHFLPRPLNWFVDYAPGLRKFIHPQGGCAFAEPIGRPRSRSNSLNTSTTFGNRPLIKRVDQGEILASEPLNSGRRGPILGALVIQC